ncbi:alpha/beta fold hydrolase [Rahnella sikkimica]|uniref:Alpha/beta hydrolase n=1 Tax=Rahnella sikkimica TaxID=1805933 RepID=A0A2L1UMK9_9GAMM|nr:alpha/beta hydrolase [Rahnella sikkimica]AVF34177.1 alpha/beta hydrolase [Rahnella sikkimica]
MFPRLKLLFCAAVLTLSVTAPAFAADAPSYGPQLQGFDYPYPVKQYSFTSQGAPLQMGYLDVAPTGHKNGQTVVLMHGKNFCAATWGDTIRALALKGYRVIAPDQIGFCSSTKPGHYQYSFQQLANNTHDLLKSLNIKKAVIVGHSTGGMLATRYSLMFAPEVSKLVLVNPIGLEDWKAKGVPYRTVDQWYDRELKTSADSIKQYELKTYYVNKWKPEYDRWVDMLAGLNNGPGHKLVAWNSALIYDMIFTQPVFYEFKNIRVPTTLMIGTSDTTAIGSDIAPPAVKAKIGNYKVLGKQAAKLIPHAKLIEFTGLGHAPQMEEPEKFNAALLKTLAR